MRKQGWSAALLAGVGLVLAGCSAADHGSTSGAGPAAVTSAVPSPSAAISLTPQDGSGKVRLDAPVSVKVSNGTLSRVLVTTVGGVPLAGSLAADRTTWTSTGTLLPSTGYRISASATNLAGRPASSSASFTTTKPSRTVSLTVTPSDGAVVGVGMPVIVSFSRSVTNRAAVQEALTVTSSPRVDGAWHWMSSQQVQYRPRSYWPAGTKVHVASTLSTIEASPGVWGRRDTAVDFTIGSAMISTVDVDRHTLTVRRNGKVLRVIPVTTGKPGFLTRNGTKIIITRESSRRMDAATTGTDPKDPNYYNVVVKYAMRLTWSGEFLHAAPWSVGSQGHANVSHGCTGMSTANAQWLFDHSKIGDVVTYVGSSRPLEWGNGYTAWDMSWAKWSAPST